MLASFVFWEYIVKTLDIDTPSMMKLSGSMQGLITINLLTNSITAEGNGVVVYLLFLTVKVIELSVGRQKC